MFEKKERINSDFIIKNKQHLNFDFLYKGFAIIQKKLLNTDFLI